jgi:predicted metalloprotease
VVSKSSTDSRSKFDTSFSGRSGTSAVVVVGGAVVVVVLVVVGGGDVVLVAEVPAVVDGAAVEEAASPSEHAARSAANMKRATPRRVPATSIPAMWALWQHLGIVNKKSV